MQTKVKARNRTSKPKTQPEHRGQKKNPHHIEVLTQHARRNSMACGVSPVIKQKKKQITNNSKAQSLKPRLAKDLTWS